MYGWELKGCVRPEVASGENKRFVQGAEVGMGGGAVNTAVSRLRAWALSACRSMGMASKGMDGGRSFRGTRTRKAVSRTNRNVNVARKMCSGRQPARGEEEEEEEEEEAW
jgi:hypothetical protein